MSSFFPCAQLQEFKEAFQELAERGKNHAVCEKAVAFQQFRRRIFQPFGQRTPAKVFQKWCEENVNTPFCEHAFVWNRIHVEDNYQVLRKQVGRGVLANLELVDQVAEEYKQRFQQDANQQMICEEFGSKVVEIDRQIQQFYTELVETQRRMTTLFQDLNAVVPLHDGRQLDHNVVDHFHVFKDFDEDKYSQMLNVAVAREVGKANRRSNANESFIIDAFKQLFLVHGWYMRVRMMTEDGVTLPSTDSSNLDVEDDVILYVVDSLYADSRFTLTIGNVKQVDPMIETRHLKIEPADEIEAVDGNKSLDQHNKVIRLDFDTPRIENDSICKVVDGDKTILRILVRVSDHSS